MNKDIAQQIIELNNKSYDAIANHFSVTRNYIWPDLKNLSEYVHEGDSILDIGCGNGRLYEELKSKKIKYFGVDGSKNLIDIARERYSKDDKSIQFGTFDIFHMPLEQKQFDAIFAIAVINHIPSKELQAEAIKKLNDLLKPDGLLLMTNWNLLRPTFSDKSLLYYNLKKWKMTKEAWKNKYGIDKKEFGLKDVMTEWTAGDESHPLYYYAFSLTEMDKLVENNGFKVLDSYYSKNGKKINRNQGNNIVTIARKV